MLRLEKIAKTLEISITLRERETVFSKTFLKALFIAIALHLMAGLMFHVRFIKISPSQTLFPPSFVEADLSLALDSGVTALVEEEEIQPKHFVEPKGSKPKIPRIPMNTVEQILELPSPKVSNHNLFAGLESDIHYVTFPLLSKISKSAPHVKIYISGGLDPESLIQEGWEGLDLNPISTLSSSYYRTLASVRLDCKEGTLYWFEFKTERTNKDLDNLSEEILKNINFKPQDHIAAAMGEIEIVFFKDINE